MSLAFGLLGLSVMAMAVWVTLMVLLYWICRVCCPTRTPRLLTPVNRCTCSDLYVSGVVKDVPNGDGFKFSPNCPVHPNSPDIAVRLAGIDAPGMTQPGQGERGQAFAQDAADFLRQLILGKTLHIDKYGLQHDQQFAWVFLPQNGPHLNVNLEMIRQGLADVYDDQICRYGDYKNEIFALLEEAKSNKRGFWSLSDAPEFTRPRNYKKQLRTQQNPQNQQKEQPPKPNWKQSKSRQQCVIL